MEIIRQTLPVFRIGDDPSLSDWIEKLKKEGVTLEVLVLLVMANKKKTGAMDRTSQSIADIVEESNQLSKLQDDLIKLNSDLSKLEAGMGNTPNANSEAEWKANKMQELIQKIADDYKRFIKDLAEVEKKGEKDPSLKALLTTVEQFKADFDGNLGGESFSEAIEQWANDTDYHGNDTGFHPNEQGEDPTRLNRCLVYLAEQYYQSNHSGAGSQSDLANFWMDGSAAQHMVTGQSQQQSIQVQAFMQTLNGYNNAAQEIIKATSDLKYKMAQIAG